MRKKPTRKRPYVKMESAMTAMLRDASGKMHHGILFDPPLLYFLVFLGTDLPNRNENGGRDSKVSGEVPPPLYPFLSWKIMINTMPWLSNIG